MTVINTIFLIFFYIIFFITANFSIGLRVVFYAYEIFLIIILINFIYKTIGKDLIEFIKQKEK